MFGGLYTGNEASSKSILNKNTKEFSIWDPRPSKTKCSCVLAVPGASRGSPKGARGWAPLGRSAECSRAPERLEHRRPGAGRPRCTGKGASGRSPDAGPLGPLPEGARTTSSAARPRRQRERDVAAQGGSSGRFLSFLPKLKFLEERPKGREEGRQPNSAPSGAFLGALRGRPAPGAPSEGGCCPLASARSPRPAPAAPRSPPGLAAPGAREAAGAPATPLPPLGLSGGARRESGTAAAAQDPSRASAAEEGGGGRERLSGGRLRARGSRS